MEDSIKRMYTPIFENHFSSNRQMILLSGPRQVGKTTVAKAMSDLYLNWDRRDDRNLLLKGEDEVARSAGLDVRRATRPLVVFDEIQEAPRGIAALKYFCEDAPLHHALRRTASWYRESAFARKLCAR